VFCGKSGPIIGGDKIKDLVGQSKFESHVRSIFQDVTGEKFLSVYPKWLIINGNQSELDGYSKKLNVAFEAQGPQHTEYLSRYDIDKSSFDQRVAKDKMKAKLCVDHGVKLIIIDYKIPKCNLRDYIISRLVDVGIKINIKKYIPYIITP
jgi:hypothetical protein